MNSFRLIACVCLALTGAAALAEDAPGALNLPEAQRMERLISNDPVLLKTFNACPADVAGKFALKPAAVLGAIAASSDVCAASPEKCYRQCSGQRSGADCFYLALAFQKDEAAIRPVTAQMLFAFACATGRASGCTNRAASLRNRQYDGDVLQQLGRKAKESCTHRTFKSACARDDNWGCAMLGQSFLNGEGVRKSRANADRAFDKACKLNPDFAACAFAKSTRK